MAEWSSEPAFFDIKGNAFGYAKVGLTKDAVMVDLSAPGAGLPAWTHDPDKELRFVTTHQNKMVFQVIDILGVSNPEIWIYEYDSSVGPELVSSAGQHPSIWNDFIVFENLAGGIGYSDSGTPGSFNTTGSVLQFPVTKGNVIAYEKITGATQQIAYRLTSSMGSETTISSPCTNVGRPRLNRTGRFILYIGESGCPAIDGVTPLYLFDRNTATNYLVGDTIEDYTTAQMETGFVPNYNTMAGYDIDNNVIAFSVMVAIDPQVPPVQTSWSTLTYLKLDLSGF